MISIHVLSLRFIHNMFVILINCLSQVFKLVFIIFCERKIASGVSELYFKIVLIGLKYFQFILCYSYYRIPISL